MIMVLLHYNRCFVNISKMSLSIFHNIMLICYYVAASDSANTMNHPKRNESKKLYDRERYKNMTPDQRQARSERQRLHNSEPKRKEALKIADNKFRVMWKHTLHPESIVMENPLYILEPVCPTVGASGADRYMTKFSDWFILESRATPLYIPPPHEEADDEGCDELLSSHMTKRSHVPSGQRHALFTPRNMMFERRIGSNTRASNKDDDCMAEDRVDANTP